MRTLYCESENDEIRISEKEKKKMKRVIKLNSEDDSKKEKREMTKKKIKN